MMPELCEQQQACNLAALAAWVMYEQDLLSLLMDEAGLRASEARLVLNGEVN